MLTHPRLVGFMLSCYYIVDDKITNILAIGKDYSPMQPLFGWLWFGLEILVFTKLLKKKLSLAIENVFLELKCALLDQSLLLFRS